MMIHFFNTDIAEAVGVNSAVILEHIKYWSEKNKANDTNFHDGRYWSYNSVNAFSKMFPYMSAKQIRLAIEKLKEADLIATANYNTSVYDRTLWYALTDKAISIFRNSKIDLPKRENVKSQKGEPIPDIVPDKIPDIDNKEIDISTLHSDISLKENPKKSAKRFVKPSLEEVRAYCIERGNSVNPESFINYYESNGWIVGGKAPMKDWKASVRYWETNPRTIAKPNPRKDVWDSNRKLEW